MKKKLLLTWLAIFIVAGLMSQPADYKILFDITSEDTSDHHTVVRHVNALATQHPGAQLEVVIYGGAIAMVLPGKSVVANPIKAILSDHKNVSFKVCQGTMNRYNIDKSMIIPGVDIVPDAIIEIVTRQGQGWGYIKESH